MKTPILLVLVASALSILSFGGCYREKPVVVELGTPEYVIENGSDYVSATIYEIYRESGVKLLYTFNPQTAMWDMGSTFGTDAVYIPFFERPEHSMAENMPVISENIAYLKEHFLDKYTTEFKKKYFPVYLFLSDSIKNGKDTETVAGIARDHLALNLYREGEVLEGFEMKGDKTYRTREEYFMEFAPRAHFALWQFIFKYRANPPELFYSYSQDLYKQNLGEKADKNYSTKQDGFWTWDEFNSFKYYRAWDADRDIADYVLRMVMYTEEENSAEMAGYQIMIDKYNALRGEIKKMTGIDLQEIGNSYASYRKEMEKRIEAQ